MREQEEEVDDLSADRADRVLELRRAFLDGTLSLDVSEDTPGFDRLLIEIFSRPTAGMPSNCLPLRQGRS